MRTHLLGFIGALALFGRSSDRGCSPIRAKRLDARLAANRPAREASLR